MKVINNFKFKNCTNIAKLKSNLYKDNHAPVTNDRFECEIMNAKPQFGMYVWKGSKVVWHNSISKFVNDIRRKLVIRDTE